MSGETARSTLRRKVVRGTALTAVLVVVAVAGAWFLQSTIPRRVVLASGHKDGAYHENAQRYRDFLGRDGVTVEERLTEGSIENLQLLTDGASGVDVAFLQGGVVPTADERRIVMLAALYYEPLWVFYRGSETWSRLDAVRYKRLAIGTPGSGVRAFVEPLLAANNVTAFNTRLVELANLDALHALQRGEVDAIFLVGPVRSRAIWEALHDTNLKLMSFERADAYVRRFPHLTKLVLPPGTVDFALHIPEREVRLIGTKAMLVARAGLPAPLSQLFIDAAHDLHDDQGYFEAPGEFPNADSVGLTVSMDATRHLRFGPSLLHRYLPFFVATYVERLIILLVPLLVVLVPLFNLIPQFLRWRARSRIYRWYGELKMLERDVDTRAGPPPVAQWLADLDRIEQGAARIKTPASYASEAYTLREHIGLVRHAVLAKAEGAAPKP